MAATNNNDYLKLSTTTMEEAMIEDNLTQNKEAVLSSMNPPGMPDLLEELKLRGRLPRRSRTRMARGIYRKVFKTKKFATFLRSLEKNTEHMGHRYIVSLLRGEEFASKEEMEESKRLQERILKNPDIVIQELSSYILDMLPYLKAEGLVTLEETWKLQSHLISPHNKARILLDLLETKGPTVYLLFTHKVVKKTNNRDLYNFLTEQADDIITTSHQQPGYTSIARSPYRLEAPEYTTSQMYLEKMGKIRWYHQVGGDEWEYAEAICKIVFSPDSKYPEEMKVEFLLEHCSLLILRGEPEDEVLACVRQARKMCQEIQHCNTQALEGSCECLLAKLYRYKGKHEKALQHVGTMFSCIINCEQGVELMLAYYCMGCILLDSPTESPDDEEKAIKFLEKALSCARVNNFGLRMKHAKFRIAQRYLGSSSIRLGKSKEEASQDSVKMAEQLLTELGKEGNLDPRTECMLSYTWFDVYRAKGDMKQAKEHIKAAEEIATRQNFTLESKSIEIRLAVLNSTPYDITLGI